MRLALAGARPVDHRLRVGREASRDGGIGRLVSHLRSVEVRSTNGLRVGREAPRDGGIGRLVSVRCTLAVSRSKKYGRSPVGRDVWRNGGAAR